MHNSQRTEHDSPPIQGARAVRGPCGRAVLPCGCGATVPPCRDDIAAAPFCNRKQASNLGSIELPNSVATGGRRLNGQYCTPFGRSCILCWAGAGIRSAVTTRLTLPTRASCNTPAVCWRWNSRGDQRESLISTKGLLRRHRMVRVESGNGFVASNSVLGSAPGFVMARQMPNKCWDLWIS